MTAISTSASATQKLCENRIKYIEISKNFTENKRENWKESSKGEYIAKLMKNDSQTSIFEILDDRVKIYFDIEKIPKENDKLIFDIVAKIISVLVDKTNIQRMMDVSYILTENLHSHTHEGRSYHLILYNTAMSKYNIKDFINYYISNKFVGYQYIDASVYTHNRLFRAVNQKGVSRFGDGLNDDDVHKIIEYYDADKGMLYDNMPENEQIKHSIIQIYDYTEYVINCTLFLSRVERIKYRKETKNASQNKFSDGWRNKPTIKNTFIFNNTPATEAATIVSTAQQSAIPSPVIPPRPAQQEPTQEQIRANKEKQIYNNFVALQILFNISKPNNGCINFIDDVIKYYEINKTYNGYKATPEQLEITANILKQCITSN